jgi:hypothetical protein
LVDEVTMGWDPVRVAVNIADTCGGGDIPGQLNTCKYFRVNLTFIIAFNHSDLNIIATYLKMSSYPAISVLTGSPNSIPGLVIRKFWSSLKLDSR